MEEVRHKRWLRLFAAVAVLLIAQVTWWAMIFVKDVRLIAELKTANLHLQTSIVPDEASFELQRDKIQRDSIRHQVMFLSESSFFALMACLGLYLLYRALKVEERSREIQRNFIEVVTHESKTPLTALKLRLESAAAKLRSPDAGQSVEREVSLALEEVRRLSSILEKALNLNRIERHAYHFENVVLADMVKAVSHRLDPFFKAHAVALTLSLDSAVEVVGDPDGLQSAVQSLLENAVLYNQGPNKQVRVDVHRLGSQVALSVADNGPGIAPADRPHVFERFYRARSAGGAQVPGTGLGLYIAKTVAEAHQGSLKLVDNGQPGACFQILLPEVQN